MKKIFVENEYLNVNDKVYITGDDYNHLVRAFRAKEGDRFIIGNNFGVEYSGQIEKIDKKNVEFCLLEKINRMNDFPRIILFFGLLKGDKNDLIIQKCTELGVSTFYPVECSNSIVKLSSNIEKKKQRWGLIAREAAMQSGSKFVPDVLPLGSVSDAMDVASSIKSKYFAQYNAFYLKMGSMPKNDNVALFIGPEGDFAEEEIEMLNDTQWKGIKLTETILRSETACICMTSIFVLKTFI